MALLKTEGLSINFGGLWAVNQVDFEIGNGEIIGLIGPNGSGKTTFFNLISGIYIPTQGVMYFKDKEMSDLTPHYIRSLGIARTFQASKLLWDLTVLDNVLTGMHSQQQTAWYDVFRPRKIKEETDECIEKARGLLAIFNPELVDRQFDKAKNIPHIDRRRLEICRAMASDPELILLDEPSAGLNRDETKEMMNDIYEMREKRSHISIIIIEHDMGVISTVSDRVFALNYGKKIAEGDYKEVAKNEEVLKAYLGGEA